MSRQLRKATLFVLAVALGGLGLWATRAAAPPASAPAAQKAPAPAGKEKQAQPRDRDFRAALRKVYDFKGIDDPKTTLIDALTMLAEKNGVAFDVNERAFKFEGFNDVLNLPIAENTPLKKTKAPLATVLKKFLERIPVPSGATFVIRRDAIEITTAQLLRHELKILVPADAESDQGLIESLPPVVWEQFSDEPLKDALQKIAEAADVTVLIDPRVGRKTEAKITATIRNLPLEAALELLADMAELAVAPKANGYYVTTRENAARMSPPRKKKGVMPPLLRFHSVPAGG
jgi:hypothetical protein